VINQSLERWVVEPHCVVSRNNNFSIFQPRQKVVERPDTWCGKKYCAIIMEVGRRSLEELPRTMKMLNYIWCRDNIELTIKIEAMSVSNFGVPACVTHVFDSGFMHINSDQRRRQFVETTVHPPRIGLLTADAPDV
jgi:hypothetical protein